MNYVLGLPLKRLLGRLTTETIPRPIDWRSRLVLKRLLGRLTTETRQTWLCASYRWLVETVARSPDD